MEIKTVKLKTHPRNFSEENLIVNIEQLNKEKIKLQIGAIIELFPPDGQNQERRKNHLFLEIKSLSPDVQARATPLSINAELASEFRLAGLRDICIRVVDSAEISLDLIELSIKDQALTRSDMWRFTSSLAGKCVFSNQKLEFAGMRAQVHRLWTIGDTVRSGSVSNTTRVLYRSSSAHMLLFIQIGVEMWDFDLSGNFYFDKAVEGFLKDLFQKWKDHSCSHEVTVMFFWRMYYSVSSRDQFPEYARRSIRQNKKGEYYQDFYKVIMDADGPQHEISSILLAIKKSFLGLSLKCTDTSLPSGQVSSSTSGNVLEAINLALNVFENKHSDVNFGVTGQQLIIVTPGQGVFDVDYDLSRLTKDRVMDRGVAVDVVCLNPQPLHAIPLFKFYRPDGDIYNIPHWMNYSCYDPQYVWDKFRFHPKLLISDHLINQYMKSNTQSTCKRCVNHENVRSPLEWVDYDEFDASVFKPNGTNVQSNYTPRRQRRIRTLSHESERLSLKPKTSGIVFNVGTPNSSDSGDDTPFVEHEEHTAVGSGSGLNPKTVIIPMSKRSSAKELSSGPVHVPRGSRARHHSTNELENTPQDRIMMGDVESMILSYTTSMESFKQQSHRPSITSNLGGLPPPRKKKPLINPFDPKKVHSELTAHHRRWIHAFPRNAEGQMFQQHHMGGGGAERDTPPSPARSQRSVESSESHSTRSSQLDAPTLLPAPTESFVGVGTLKVSPAHRPLDGNLGNTLSQWEGHYKSPSPMTMSEVGNMSETQAGLEARTVLCGRQLVCSEGLERWGENFASVKRTGTDWQSLTEPASLPITCDYFPSNSDLSHDFVEHPFTVVVSTLDSSSSTNQNNLAWRSSHPNMNTFQAFREMISQRIIQGFQLVFEEGVGGLFSLNQSLSDLEKEVHNQKSSPNRHSSSFHKLNIIHVKMSLGRLFHHLELNYPDILVHIYKSKSSIDNYTFNYTYQLCADDPRIFHTTYTDFVATRTADYNWNYLDQHVCGYQDFEQLQESQRYFSCRFLLLPRDFHPSGNHSMCEELVAGFVKFVDFLNHIKRGHHTEKARRGNTYRLSLPIVITTQHSTQLPGLHPGSEVLPEIVEEGPKQDSPGLAPPSIEKGSWVGGIVKSPSLHRLKSDEARKQGGGGKKVETLGGGAGLASVGMLVQRSKSKEELPLEKSDIRYSSVPKKAKTKDEILQELKKVLMDDQLVQASSSLDITLLQEMKEGLEVIPPHAGLKSGCIVGTEAVKWMIENKKLSRADAVELLQKMFAQKCLMHASNDSTVGFVDGYYLYTMPPLYQDSQDDQTSHSGDASHHDAFSKYWFEMAIEMPSDEEGAGPESPVSISSTTTVFTSLDHSPTLYYRGVRRKDSVSSSLHQAASDMVEMNPDTNAKSDRPEWCYVHYDKTYNPKKAFQLEFQWVASTPCLLYQLMQVWVHKASLCSFYLVPAPSKSTFHQSSDACHFRKRHFIPLNLPSRIANMWMEWDADTLLKNVSKLLSGITNSFGFLIDPSPGPQDTQQDGSSLSTIYVHHTGCAFLHSLASTMVAEPPGEDGIASLCRLSCGFYWYKNYLAMKQKGLGTGVPKHDTLLADFTSLCSNEKEKLQLLYNQVFESYSSDD
ncbi:hypothetical protein EMCRGX_G024886 [Ephydatia muelleri]